MREQPSTRAQAQAAVSSVDHRPVVVVPVRTSTPSTSVSSTTTSPKLGHSTFTLCDQWSWYTEDVVVLPSAPHQKDTRPPVGKEVQADTSLALAGPTIEEYLGRELSTIEEEKSAALSIWSGRSREHSLQAGQHARTKESSSTTTTSSSLWTRYSAGQHCLLTLPVIWFVLLGLLNIGVYLLSHPNVDLFHAALGDSSPEGTARVQHPVFRSESNIESLRICMLVDAGGFLLLGWLPVRYLYQLACTVRRPLALLYHWTDFKEYKHNHGGCCRQRFAVCMPTQRKTVHGLIASGLYMKLLLLLLTWMLASAAIVGILVACQSGTIKTTKDRESLHQYVGTVDTQRRAVQIETVFDCYEAAWNVSRPSFNDRAQHDCATQLASTFCREYKWALWLLGLPWLVLVAVLLPLLLWVDRCIGRIPGIHVRDVRPKRYRRLRLGFGQQDCKSASRKEGQESPEDSDSDISVSPAE